MLYSIAQLNQMDEAEFVRVVGVVFEHTPSIARRVWQQRPFASAIALHQQMAEVVLGMPTEEQLALIHAHPDLGSKAAMADASVQEQAGVGLDRLTLEEFERFQSLNQRYKERFCFPFIVAVKNHTKDSILAEFDRRLEHSVDTEREQALAEIIQIAGFRLSQIVAFAD